MIEIQLPCCDGPAVIEPDAIEIRCEACGLTLELAPDAREPRAGAAATLPAAA
ncbi:MAG: hypothetical protein HY263_04510 [Chloroflexi bacterium]|nr:hypothetical protein [Chloroflexota bacterium]